MKRPFSANSILRPARALFSRTVSTTLGSTFDGVIINSTVSRGDVPHLLFIAKTKITCSGKGSGGALTTAATDVWLNSGPGQRLDGQSTSKNSAKDGAGLAAGGGMGGMSSEDMQIAMAISASMAGGGSDDEGVGGVGGDGGGEEDDVAKAIALSLSQESTSAPSSSGIYQPQPVPEPPAKGPDAVRVQVCGRRGDLELLALRCSFAWTGVFCACCTSSATANARRAP